MNELDEKILALAEKGCYETNCSKCIISQGITKTCSENIARHYAELLREREANPGVWDGAPEWATVAWVNWSDGECRIVQSSAYRRTPPKDAKRIMAERIAEEIRIEYEREPGGVSLADIIERGLRKE